ncbi:terminase small subunit [Arthrobacter phage Ottawa]|nr:terminase small subunit [Arthrobacter phage Kharcho]WIC89308.1 terminase small subunit [Arthrobacter phage Ottawa]
MAGKNEDGTPRRGANTKLTLTRLKNIITVLVAGNYVGTACEFAGIGRTSFDDWRRRGEREMDRVNGLEDHDADEILEAFEGKDPAQVNAQGQPMDKASPEYMWANRPEVFDEHEWPYVVFQAQVLRARASAEVRALHQINSAMGSNWQAAAWFLERTQPERYGRQHLRVSHEGSTPGSPVATVVTVETVEEKLKGLLGG